ncbi:MAG TPA: hypothetical protein VF520_12865 [Thermoleophilaceae bacterium]|jgi:hypothetical protein
MRQEHPEPTVHVAIGRVEIRATRDGAPGPSRKDPEDAARPLSLDEYLREHAGVRRR